MDARRFKLCRTIFENLVELPAAERAEKLIEHCGNDMELRREVESMLAADDAAESKGFLNEKAAGQVARAATDLTGLRIGKYRLVRAIASGGMGTVYEAEQENPRKRVAVKVLHAAFASKGVLRRFQVESEILARFRHPALAQVFDAGIHSIAAEGFFLELPWYALEFLEGARTITQYAEERPLAMRERVALFVTVCEAVHHAHVRGVVHRDLKPQNILVDAAGHPKVIDFGVARASSDGDGVPSMHTATGELVGTLRYMAPEQFSGDSDAIDTRTDVYALGLVLYELLCGSFPFDFEGREITDVGRIVRETPPKPPRRVEPSVPEELEWILLKTLEKEPARRYASAAELASDLGRFERNEPVLAGPPSKAYRLQKFVARNRVVVSAGLVVFVALVGGLVASLVSLERARTAEEIAKHEESLARVAEKRADEEARVAKLAQKTAEENEANAEFVSTLFQGALTEAVIGKVGRDLRVVDVLADMSRSLDRDRGESAPRVAAMAHHHIAVLYYSLAEYESAQQHFLARVEALERIAHESDDHGSAIVETRLNLAQIYLRRGLLDDALAQLELAKSVLDAPENAQFEPLAEKRPALLHRIGSVMSALGRFDEAEASLRGAVRAHEDQGTIEAESGLDAMNALAVLLMNRGKLDEAEPICRRVVDGLSANHGDEHPYTLMAVQNLASLYRDRKEYGRALELLVPQLAIRERVAGAEHSDTLKHRQMIATTLSAAGRNEEAIEMLSPAIESRRKRHGSSDADYLRMLGLRAQQLIAVGRLEDAIDDADRAAREVVDDGSVLERTQQHIRIEGIAGYARALKGDVAEGSSRLDAAIARAERLGGSSQLTGLLRGWREKVKDKAGENGP